MKTKEMKQSVIAQYQLSPHDTGSIQVQIALLTDRIEQLTKHFNTHKHDANSMRGLLILVNRRRKFLTYLMKNEPEVYRQLISRLGIRK